MKKLEKLMLFQNSPIGSIVFIRGKGFVSNGIRLFQSIESIHTAKEINDKRNIDIDLDYPTHAEMKVSRTHDISAEMKGVEKVKFSRFFDKDVGVEIARPTVDGLGKWKTEIVYYLNKKVEEDTPYDYYGFFSYLYRSLDLVLPLRKLKKYDWEYAEYCSELVCRAYKLMEEPIIELKEDCSTLSPKELYIACENSDKMEIIKVQ